MTDSLKETDRIVGATNSGTATATDSLKERLAKLSGAGFNPIYSEALARIEGLETDIKDYAYNLDNFRCENDQLQATIAKLEGENKRLQQDRDFLIKHAHHIDDMDEIAMLKATIAKLEGENKRMRQRGEELGAAVESQIIEKRVLQGKLDRALDTINKVFGIAYPHPSRTFDTMIKDMGLIDDLCRSILSDLSPKDQGHE